MGRRPRTDAAGAWHHVMNRGAGRRVVFRDDVDRETFIELLAEVPARFDTELHCYCLMGNHFHLLVRSGDGRISEAMQWLSGGFTRRINGRRDVDGAVFRGRFHSVLVTSDRHLVYLVRYIHANPLGLGWDLPFDRYRWSSLGQLTGLDPPCDWLEQRVVLGWFGGDRPHLNRFVEQARDKVHDDSGLDARPDQWSRPDPNVGIAELAEAVDLARHLTGGAMRADAARLATALLACDYAHIDRAHVARHFELKPSSVRSALSRARDRMRSDRSFGDIVRTAAEMASPSVALGV